MRCSQSPCKFGLTVRFLYNVTYSVTIFLSPCSLDMSWIIHDAASCCAEMHNVSAIFSYLMSSLAFDASGCHTMLFCVLYYVRPNVTLTKQLESNSPKGLHCLCTTWTELTTDQTPELGLLLAVCRFNEDYCVNVLWQVSYWNNN